MLIHRETMNNVIYWSHILRLLCALPDDEVTADVEPEDELGAEVPEGVVPVAAAPYLKTVPSEFGGYKQFLPTQASK